MLRYIVDNAKWCINKQYFVHLLGHGMSCEQLECELLALTAGYRHSEQSGALAVNDVRFALNDNAMTTHRHQWAYGLSSLYATYWNLFVALSSRLSGVQLPGNGSRVRIDAVVELYMRATQNHRDDILWGWYKDIVTDSLSLTARELAYIDDVLLLYRCMYYCAVCRNVATTNSDRYMCCLSADRQPSSVLENNDSYSNMTYNGGIQTVIDCFGASAVMLGASVIDSSMSLDISANGRNVLDTFTQHLYGDSMSQFASRTKSISVSMRYMLKRCSEVRTVDIVGGVRSQQRYSVNVHATVKGIVQSFTINNCHCMCVGGSASYYVSYALVDSKYNIVSSGNLTDNGCGVDIDITHSMLLGNGQRGRVHIVAMYGNCLRDITDQIERIQRIGYCDREPFECNSAKGRQYEVVTNVTPCSNMYVGDKGGSIKRHNYTYQFGDSDISTLLDNEGNGCTMLEGFVFGASEKVYYYKGNKITAINCGKFAINANGYSHSHTIGNDSVSFEVEHRHAKVYTVDMPRGGGVLFVLPLEQHSKVSAIDGGFDVVSNSRHFVVRYTGKLDSFTTNSIECSSRRLRRHLSGDCSVGDSLAMSFVGGNKLQVEIVNCNKLPLGRAVVRQSLLSTYHNYINNKNIYLAVNKLRPVDALMLASMVYTNSNYVWQYLIGMEQGCSCESGISYYYNNSMHMASSSSSMTYPLALLYYATVTGNVEVLTTERIGRLQYMLYEQEGSTDSRHICLVALALKKLSKLNIDKVNVLINYTNIKKAIMANKDSYAYAQAIGAVPMVNASKQRLKSLVAQHNIPKCFYYVSQLENLYGIELVGNRLNVSPSVSSGLEQLLLQVGNRKIDTTFDNMSGKTMAIDGYKCSHGVDVSQLDQDSQHTLVVGCGQ